MLIKAVEDMEGTVYLIHLETPVAGHAQHYIGWAANVEARLYYHRKQRGAKLLAHAVSLGIAFDIVREWAGGKDLERKLKNRKKARLLCPVCRK
ncbi:hypothetical protein, partial [Nibrella saemangeumensis]|uniref:hypothetical protein n=1 Tax=Nibrella saemangeumensis TaxID=1084526 RepID=UPI0031EA640D